MGYSYYYVCNNIDSWSVQKNSDLIEDSWWRYWKYSNKCKKQDSAKSRIPQKVLRRHRAESASAVWSVAC